MHPLSLEQLTIMDVTPPELVSIAAALDCQAISLYVEPPGGGIEVYPLIEDTPVRRETIARLGDTGVVLHNLEAYVLAPDTRVDSYRKSLEAGARMGAKTATVIIFDPNRGRVTDRFAQLCVRASELGLRINAEFFAGSELKSFRDALALVSAAAQPNAGIVVDSLHIARTGSALADVARTDPRLIGNAQISDGPLTMPPDQQNVRSQRSAPDPWRGGITVAQVHRSTSAQSDDRSRSPAGNSQATRRPGNGTRPAGGRSDPPAARDSLSWRCQGPNSSSREVNVNGAFNLNRSR